MMQKLGAEFLGTFVFLFIGLGAAVLGNPGALGVALAFGLGATAMIYAVGSLSGGHFNPAVTLAMAINGRFCWGSVLPYMIAQVMGGIAAAGLLHIIGSGAHEAITNLSANGWGEHSAGGYGQHTAMIAEVAATAMFVMIVLGVSKSAKAANVGPMVVGLALGMLILVMGNVTGGSLNPARSMGPAVMMGGAAWEQLWLFWVAPLLGAIVGAYLFKWAICCGTCSDGGHSCSSKK